MEQTRSYLVPVLLVLCHLSVLLRQLALSHQCHRLGRLALLVLLALLAPSDQ